MLFTGLLSRYRLLETLPVVSLVGRGRVVEEMSDGVVIVEADRRVRDLNPKAEALFGVFLVVRSGRVDTGLSDGVTEDPDTLTDRIDSLAGELAEVGETVERADRIMQETLAYESVDPAAVARSVVADGTAPLRTDPEVLRAALGEGVENAVEHGDSPVPTVRIGVACAGDGVRITVRDDGPGIPERERRVLLEGEEDPLRHGLGVGLWFVSWAAARLPSRFRTARSSGYDPRFAVLLSEKHG